MKEVLVGIGSSVAATVIVAMFAWRFRKHCRIAINKIFDTGILYIYKDQEEAEPDIRESFRHSTIIKVLTLRGKSFLSDMGRLGFIVNDLGSWQTLKFMMSDPDPGVDPNYIRLRAEELLEIDGQDANDFLEEVRQDVTILARKGTQLPISPKLHNSPAVFRLISFEDEMYLLFYSRRSRAINNQVYRCPSSSELYKACNRYFDLVYVDAKKLKTRREGVRSKEGKSKIKNQKGIGHEVVRQAHHPEQSRGKAQKGEKDRPKNVIARRDCIPYNLPKVCRIPCVDGNCGF